MQLKLRRVRKVAKEKERKRNLMRERQENQIWRQKEGVRERGGREKVKERKSKGERKAENEERTNHITYNLKRKQREFFSFV